MPWLTSGVKMSYPHDRIDRLELEYDLSQVEDSDDDPEIDQGEIVFDLRGIVDKKIPEDILGDMLINFQPN